MPAESELPRPEALEVASSGQALPITPALALLEDPSATPAESELINSSVLRVCGLAILLGVTAAFVAQLLVALIGLVTNLAFYQRFSIEEVSPAHNELGLWVIFVPVIGGLIVGLMARYGSKAIRGHGIPEAMEQVLTNKSRIPARLTFLKPLSAAISIGTGGPFGAEGPIIATGGALGSLIGQVMPMNAAERKTLLAAGAAAGMTAIFGTPLAALLLAIELLLFEFRPRSLIPVTLATIVAEGARIMLIGSEPVFVAHFAEVTPLALFTYIVLGALMGVAAALVTHTVYAIEDAFEKLPIHWMWWPALGAVVVGVVGYFAPRTLGVGYENIQDLIQGNLALGVLAWICGMKFISWSISLGSGTSGGTLAPLLTIGGGLGGAVGIVLHDTVPALGIEPGLAALVGMAAMFAGATRAPLASSIFAFEITMQPVTLLPLLAGCIASYLVSCRIMQNTIMTEKIARRGVRTPSEYVADIFDVTVVGKVATRQVVALNAHDTLAQTRQWFASHAPETRHQGYPVLDGEGHLVGVLTHRDLRETNLPAEAQLSALVKIPVRFVYPDTTLRQAIDHLLNHDIGRLPVMSRATPPRLVGFLTRSDVLGAQRQQIDEDRVEVPSVVLRRSR